MYKTWLNLDNPIICSQCLAMYSQPHSSPVDDEITFLENLLFGENLDTDINHIKNSDVHPQPIPNYQEPKPVFQNVIGGVPGFVSVDYQQANCLNNSNQLGQIPVQNTFQELSHPQFLPCNMMQQGSFHNNQQKLYQPQTNYINKKAGLKGIGKRKRKRTMFTTEQVAVLEKVFLTKPYISRDERQNLVQELQIDDKVIKVWFQNRRLKEKREAEEAAQELNTPDADANDAQYKFDELSYVESQINQTDQFGYVNLDSKAINDLVSVLDNILTQETDINLTKENEDTASKIVKEEGETKSSVIYEPISPASSECTSSVESTSYEPCEPEETLQRILDIQEFLIWK